MILDDKLIKYILYKKRTENEVRYKCKMLNYEEAYIDEIMEYLKENKYIDDEAYATRYIKNIMNLKSCSVNEIKMDLLKRGINENIIERNITDDVYKFEEKSALNLANKKCKNMEIEKIKRYLLNKGFSYDNVSKAIDNLKNLEDN